MVTQNVFDGRGTDRVPHKNTINGIGNARMLAEATWSDERRMNAIKTLAVTIDDQVIITMWMNTNT